MLEVVLKHRLAGSFSSGIEVAQSQVTQMNALNTTSTPANDGGGRFTAVTDAKEIVMHKLNSERGMSLVEATIILMVLAILTAVVAPSVGDYVNDARDVKVKEDVEAIGTGIIRMLRDSKETCLQLNAGDGTGVCSVTNRVDALVTDGAEPTSVVDNAYTTLAGNITGASINWFGAAAAEPTQFDTVDNQLMKNIPGGSNQSNRYAEPSVSLGGPRAGLGWRGAYLSGVTPDPWGNMYQVNTAFLSVATDVAGPGHGQTSGVWRYDTFVISAGRNATLETKFADSTITAAGTVVGGDDVVYVIQGSTR